MSDKEIELTEEQLKEQKLEAARKKYEELKNKNKKKKKKSKKDKQDDVKEDASGKEESVEPSDEPKEETKDDDVNEESNEVNEEVKEETKEESQEESKEEETKEEPNEDKEKIQLGTAVEEQVSEEPKPEEKSKIESKSEEQLSEKLSDLKVEEPPANEEKAVIVDPSADDPVEELFPSSGPSFMDSIKQSQSDEALSKVQQENQSLKEELGKIKAENKDLKMLKLEHLDQIETLEAKVSDLESKLAKAKVDSTNHLNTSVYDQDDNLSLSPTPSFQQSFPTSFSQFKPHQKNESQLSLTELKARLNKWKNWNVDMTNWRSVGSGPIVEL